jgi:hypothetical protein
LTRKLVFHVGAPKTGSTYLQWRLRANAARLREHGIYVPVLPAVARMAGNAKLLATALAGTPSLSFRRAFPDIDAAALAPQRVLADLLADWRDDEAAILSAENFRPSHARLLRDLVPSDVPCTVVLFVRRQDSWVESYYNQLVKADEVHGDVAHFIDTVCDGPDERFCCPDWSVHYEAWRAAFGTCRVIFYDEVRNDIFGALLRAAELCAPPEVADVPPTQVSLDTHQLAYLLQLERPIEFADFARRRAASGEASLRLGAPPFAHVLGTRERMRLHERFDASNRTLLAALGRSTDTQALTLGDAAAHALTLDEVYVSAEYRAHRALADSLFANCT